MAVGPSANLKTPNGVCCFDPVQELAPCEKDLPILNHRGVFKGRYSELRIASRTVLGEVVGA
jgi:hypothetical protein